MSKDYPIILADKLAEAISAVLPVILKREMERICNRAENDDCLEKRKDQPENTPQDAVDI
jgi:hypothetical protein